MVCLTFSYCRTSALKAGGQQSAQRGIQTAMGESTRYLKKHTEALVKDVGVEAACEVTGRSKATLGRYYSDAPEHADRFMPVDAVLALEKVSSFPHVTSALAELCGNKIEIETSSQRNSNSVNADVVALAQRFAMLMGEYNQSIEDGVITTNEAKRMLQETLALQKVLVEMKLHLEEETAVPGAG